MRPRVYLSGPLTQGDRSHNVCQFMQAHRILIEAGFAVMNPGLTAMLPWAWEVPHETWLDSDLAWVDCADVVVRLPGESVGADREVARARKQGIPVAEWQGEFNPEDLIPWAKWYLNSKSKTPASERSLTAAWSATPPKERCDPIWCAMDPCSSVGCYTLREGQLSTPLEIG